MHRILGYSSFLCNSLRTIHSRFKMNSTQKYSFDTNPSRYASCLPQIQMRLSQNIQNQAFSLKHFKISTSKSIRLLQSLSFFNFSTSKTKQQTQKTTNLESSNALTEDIVLNQTTKSISKRLSSLQTTQLNINFKIQNPNKELKQNLGSKLTNDSQFMELLLFAQKHLGIFGVALIIAFGIFYFVVIRFGNQIWQKADQFYEEFKKMREEKELILEYAHQLNMKYDEWQNKSELYKQVVKQTKQLLHFGINAEKFMEQHFKIRLIEATQQDSIFQVLLSLFFSLKNFTELVRKGRIFILQNGASNITASKEQSLDILRQISVVTAEIQDILKAKRKKIRIMKFLLVVLQKSSDQVMFRLFGDQIKDDMMNQMGNSSISDYLLKYENQKIVLILDRFEQFYVLMQDPKKKDKLLNIFTRLRQLSSSGWVNIIAIGYNTTFINELTKQANAKQNQFRIGSYFIKKEVFQNHCHNFVEFDLFQKIVRKYQYFKEIGPEQAKILNNIYNLLKTPNSSMGILSLVSQFEKELQLTSNKKVQKTIPANLLNNVVVKLQNFLSLELKNKRSYIKSKVFIGNQQQCQKKIILLMKIFLKEQLLYKWNDKQLIIQNLSEEERKVYEQLCKHQIIYYFDFFSKDYPSLFINIIQENEFYEAILKSYVKGLKEAKS